MVFQEVNGLYSLIACRKSRIAVLDLPFEKLACVMLWSKLKCRCEK